MAPLGTALLHLSGLMGDRGSRLRCCILQENPRFIVETAHGQVSGEMNVLLSIRVSFAAQEWNGAIQVAVLIACEAKSLIRGLQHAYSPRTQCPHD